MTVPAAKSTRDGRIARSVDGYTPTVNQLQAAARLAKQRATEPVLEQLDLPGQRLGRDVELLARGVEFDPGGREAQGEGGLCQDPAETLDSLFERLVVAPPRG